MPSPLVTRPPYGQGHPAMPTAESRLPSGPPAGKGLPLPDDQHNGDTFAKPEDDIRSEGGDDESIHRVDDAGDLLKEDQSRQDRRDHENFKPRYDSPGKDVTPKTPYPYRDGIPNAHNASRRFPPMSTKTPMEVAASLKGLLASLENPGQDRPSREKLASDLNGLLVDLGAQPVKVAAAPTALTHLDEALMHVKRAMMAASSGRRKRALMEMSALVASISNTLNTMDEAEAAEFLARANVKVAMAARTSPPDFEPETPAPGA